MRRKRRNILRTHEKMDIPCPLGASIREDHRLPVQHLPTWCCDQQSFVFFLEVADRGVIGLCPEVDLEILVCMRGKWHQCANGISHITVYIPYPTPTLNDRGHVCSVLCFGFCSKGAEFVKHM